MQNQKVLVWALIVALIASMSGLIFVLFLYRQQETNFNEERLALKANIASQKKDKDTISIIWEEQAAQNDILVNRQTALLDQVNLYLANVSKSIRFINTVPQFTPEANEANFKLQLNNLNTAINNLNTATAENNAKKEEYKLKIETIYQQSGEDLKNRANPDGIK
jgi:hypothetical protein